MTASELVAKGCMGREWELLLVTRRQSIPPPLSGGSPWCETSLSPQQQLSIGHHTAHDPQVPRGSASSLLPRTAPRKGLAPFWKILGNIRDTVKLSTSFLFVLHATPPREVGRGCCVQWAAPTPSPPCLLCLHWYWTGLLTPPQRTNWPPLPVPFAQSGVATHRSSEIFVFIASFKKKLATEQSVEMSGPFFPQRCSRTALPRHSCSLLGWALMLLPPSLPLQAQKLESLGHHAGPVFFLPLVCSALLCDPSGPQKSDWPVPVLQFPGSLTLFQQEPPCTDLAWEVQTWGEIQADFSASKLWRWELIL